MSDFVTLQNCEHYTLVSMDDGKANAFSFAMLEGLATGLDEAEAAGRPIVLAGRPGKFSAGFDLSVMSRMNDQTFELLQQGAGLAIRLLRCPVPVVLAVSGHALAMGALVLCASDYRIGIRGDYKLGLNEVAIGMTLPHFGVELARYRLTDSYFDRAVNLAQVYDPETAVSAGYLDEVVDADGLLEHAAEIATQLASLDMGANAATKLRARQALITALEGSVDREFAQLRG